MVQKKESTENKSDSLTEKKNETKPSLFSSKSKTTPENIFTKKSVDNSQQTKPSLFGKSINKKSETKDADKEQNKSLKTGSHHIFNI